MKKKIQDMVQGRFESADARLLLPDKNLEFAVIENEIYEGEFVLSSSTDAPVRGIVTCPNPHISCMDTEFDSKKAVIRFSYCADRLVEGDVEDGHFVITSNAGEYLLAFRARITKKYLHSSIGVIKTLNDFTNLCKLNWEEAQKIFQSPHFFNIFREEADFCRLLYAGLTGRSNGSHEMEEFLIGCGKKKRCRFWVSGTDRNFRVGAQTVSDSISVGKSEWGNIDIEVRSDAPFIRLPKARIRMYDFAGKHAEVVYQIDPSLMHGGRNYAVITFRNCFQEEQVRITATAGAPREGKKPSVSAQKNRLHFKLEQSYLAYRRGLATAAEWLEESTALLGQAKELDPDNQWNYLFAAYIYLKCDMRPEAEKEIARLPRNLRGQRSPLSAFYLYLTTFGEDAAYVREVTARVREIYLKYQGHPVLVWILLQIDDALLRNAERRYNMIRKFITESGSRSPMFYQEAAGLLRENPQLLHRQEGFEMRLICWMSGKNMLNPALAMRILTFAQTRKQYEASFFRVLSRCYKLLPDPGSAKTICTYLIKMNRYGEAYFPWFQRGIEQHLKIAGLYEAYMLSWNKANGELPNEVIKYFSMSSSLPARRKALLFSYVVRNRQRLGAEWDSYMEMVKKFAAEELKKGNMSEELAVIYEEVRRQVKKEQWEEWKGGAEQSYRLYTSGGRISNVRVFQAGVAQGQRVPVYQSGAYICLWRKPFVILYEDAAGELYTAKDHFRIRKMLSGKNIYAEDAEPAVLETHEEIPVQKQDLQEQLKLFAGSIEEMSDLIRRAQAERIDVLKYQEQLLVRMLFTDRFPDGHEKLFAAVRSDPEAVTVADAYVSRHAYLCMRDDAALPDAVRDYIGEALQQKRHLNAYCETAFLKSYAGRPEEEWAEQAERILRKYLLNGSYFDFYRTLPLALRKKYILLGIRVIEYVDEPGRLLYVKMSKKSCIGGEPAFLTTGRELMTEPVPGLYTLCVRLLAGDGVEYSILNREGDYLASGTIEQPSCPEELADTRYGKISKLTEDAADSRLQYTYAEQNDLTDILFVPIEE